MRTEYDIIGMMSGTSLDGMDLAFCHFQYHDKWIYQLLAAKTYQYPPEILNSFKTMQQPTTPFLKFKQLQIEYSQFIATMIKQFIHQNRIKRVDLVSIHGHTIFHKPQQKITVQAANLNTIAAMLEIDVVGNFRELDVMRGGQGAPLAPYGEQLFQGDVFINFGGVCNIGRNGKGWDINYCNLISNHFAFILQNKQFDLNGEIGKRGKICPKLLEYLQLNAKNISLRSLEREGFQQLLRILAKQFKCIRIQDILHTFYVFLSKQINESVSLIYQNDLPERVKVLCTGGGSKNVFLMSLIRQIANGSVQYIVPESNIVDFKEAIIFAYLGLKHVQNIPNCSLGIGGMMAKGRIQ